MSGVRHTILFDWSADSATRIDEGVVMNRTIQSVAVMALIVWIGAVQVRSGRVLAGESEQKPLLR